MIMIPDRERNHRRNIPFRPEKILDAPELKSNYSLNLVDWSKTNILAAALGNAVYVLNLGTNRPHCLLKLNGNDYVCSVNWIEEGNCLAVGTSRGEVELWDVPQEKRLRVMDGNATRISSLAWNSHILSSSTQYGAIIHHDVRQKNHWVATLLSHTHEVIGLKWSPDGRYLASGGNDNLLNIWSGIPGQATFQTDPIYRLESHQAPVKALAWCPWNPSILASGGGTADGHIRFWECKTGACVNYIDGQSQVSSLVWAPAFKEIISGHGIFANNQIAIWKWPNLEQVAVLTGHTKRILHLGLSPAGTTVLSASADETIRMWRCCA